MSYDLIVELKRTNMPTPDKWHSSIIDAGFPADLYKDFDVDSHTGFLPCHINGEVSGFEYYARGIDQNNSLPSLPSADFSILFSIGSRPLELVSALAASSTLAAISSGTVVDPQSGESVISEHAIAWAKAQLAQLGA
jgi:hypothetical protein